MVAAWWLPNVLGFLMRNDGSGLSTVPDHRAEVYLGFEMHSKASKKTTSSDKHDDEGRERPTNAARVSQK